MGGAGAKTSAIFESTVCCRRSYSSLPDRRQSNDTSILREETEDRIPDPYAGTNSLEVVEQEEEEDVGPAVNAESTGIGSKKVTFSITPPSQSGSGSFLGTPPPPPTSMSPRSASGSDREQARGERRSERRSHRDRDGDQHRHSRRREKDKDHRVPKMDESNKAMVTQLRELASRIEGRCTKFPTSGGGLLGFSRERYVAVLPFDDVEGAVNFREQTQGMGWGRQLGLWRRGKLGYWHAQENFRREEEPKGGVPLMTISKVEWDPLTPFDVSVRHKDKESGSTQELILQFPTEDRARQWRETLHRIRSLLQQTVMQA